MKLFLITACWVLIGCGVIFGLVHGIVPHLLTPDLFPKAQAREVQHVPVENVITSAGFAVGAGTEHK
ncbi:hypothetical protein VT84_22410 [Gemmata sp. SH-PL17]|uniref:hypothetical protein n=1 Tax=Gemmata sp. SH-PL17 TaxID=1630693 RepID=UPI0004B4A579|nr:hypothetical protein [Gemmata sp. SH-PL17]AMV27172.1 hypothetical protein VT84_22410 [Gemmata sp. SH-PL17]